MQISKQINAFTNDYEKSRNTKTPFIPKTL